MLQNVPGTQRAVSICFAKEMMKLYQSDVQNRKKRSKKKKTHTLQMRTSEYSPVIFALNQTFSSSTSQQLNIDLQNVRLK